MTPTNRKDGCNFQQPTHLLETTVKTIYTLITSITILLSIQWVGFKVLVNLQPEAPSISASQIRSLQTVEDFQDRFVIVDVRAKGETDVSVIPGAITKTEFENSIEQHDGKTVVVYCTVGYRSGIYAKQLQRDGWDARNYKGSILDWCGNALPVVTPDGKSTCRVHTYDFSYPLASGYVAVY